MDWVTILLTGLVMAIGLVGVVLPFIPGAVLVWAAALGFGLLGGFAEAGWAYFVVITILAVLGQFAQYALPSRAGVEAGASRRTLALGAVGGVVGFFVIPVLGLPIGAVLGVLVGEYGESGDWSRATSLTRDVVIGFGLGILAELLAGLLMVVTWVVWVFATR